MMRRILMVLVVGVGVETLLMPQARADRDFQEPEGRSAERELRENPVPPPSEQRRKVYDAGPLVEGRPDNDFQARLLKNLKLDRVVEQGEWAQGKTAREINEQAALNLFFFSSLTTVCFEVVTKVASKKMVYSFAHFVLNTKASVFTGGGVQQLVKNYIPKVLSARRSDKPAIEYPLEASKQKTPSSEPAAQALRPDGELNVPINVPEFSGSGVQGSKVKFYKPYSQVKSLVDSGVEPIFLHRLWLYQSLPQPLRNESRSRITTLLFGLDEVHHRLYYSLQQAEWQSTEKFADIKTNGVLHRWNKTSLSTNRKYVDLGALFKSNVSSVEDLVERLRKETLAPASMVSSERIVRIDPTIRSLVYSNDRVEVVETELSHNFLRNNIEPVETRWVAELSLKVLEDYLSTELEVD